MNQDSTRRFSGRAEVYSKFRPRYPKEILEILSSTTGFDKLTIVADVASGTGILSEIFVQNGNKVYGVEPNDDMRSVAERNLAAYQEFVSVKGSAEHTNLQDASVDLVTVGQALHWFDLGRARVEFSRVLRRSGHICIVYNERSDNELLMREYEEIVSSHATKDMPMNEYVPPSQFFGSSAYAGFEISNKQILDFAGLVGRVASASYSPDYGDKGFASLERDLRLLFDKWQADDRITLLYRTRVFIGQIPS